MLYLSFPLLVLACISFSVYTGGLPHRAGDWTAAADRSGSRSAGLRRRDNAHTHTRPYRTFHLGLVVCDDLLVLLVSGGWHVSSAFRLRVRFRWAPTFLRWWSALVCSPCSFLLPSPVRGRASGRTKAQRSSWKNGRNQCRVRVPATVGFGCILLGVFSFTSPGGVTEEPRFRSRYHRLRQRHKDTSELRIELQPGTEEQLQSPPVSSHTAPPDRAALEKMNTRTNTHAHEHSFHCDLWLCRETGIQEAVTWLIILSKASSPRFLSRAHARARHNNY